MSKQGIIKNLLESGQYTSTDLNRIANTPDARKIQNCQYAVALNSCGQWCEWDDLTPEERASWVRGQNAADAEWERRKNGEPSLTLAQELLERESAGLLMHC